MSTEIEVANYIVEMFYYFHNKIFLETKKKGPLLVIDDQTE